MTLRAPRRPRQAAVQRRPQASGWSGRSECPAYSQAIRYDPTPTYGEHASCVVVCCVRRADGRNRLHRRCRTGPYGVQILQM